jgi:deazaflavin-dependent oxidoreductase (nitroreductase family)
MGSPKDWNKMIIEEFRANEGKVGGRFAGQPLALLHTVGAKSGQPRINPVACMRDGDRYVIVASKAGAPVNPDWYYNLVAHPQVTVEYGTETFQAQATVATEPERTRLYNQMAADRPTFAEYEQKTTRKIPVIILTRVE